MKSTYYSNTTDLARSAKLNKYEDNFPNIWILPINRESNVTVKIKII